MHDGIDPADKPDVGVRTWTPTDWAIALLFVALLAIAALTAGDQPVNPAQLWR